MELIMEYCMWFWLIMGVLLMIAELFVPGVFVIWLGLAAVLNGILLSFIDMRFSFQLLSFAGFSIVCVLLGWYVYGQVMIHSSKKEYSSLNNGAEAFIGKEYLLTEDVVNGRSKVRVGDTVWLAQAPNGLKAGTPVVVEKVDGVLLFVKEKTDN